MFSFASLTAIALSLAPVLSRPIPHATAPSTYATGYLEDYATYHERYLAIGCHDKHDTPFFDDCCHPMLAVETLEKNRKPYCLPGAAPAPSASPSENAEDEQECEEEEEDQPAPSPAPSPAEQEVNKPAPTPSSDQKQPSETHEDAKPETHEDAKPETQEEAKPAPTNKPDHNNDDNQAKNDSKNQDQDKNNNGNGQGSGGSITGGFATFFYQNGIAGACGTVHGDNDMIAAIDIHRYGNTGQKSGLCGQQVRVTNAKNGKSVTVRIEDACPTCNNGNSIDLSKGAFLAIADESEGIVPISWDFV